MIFCMRSVFSCYHFQSRFLIITTTCINLRLDLFYHFRLNTIGRRTYRGFHGSYTISVVTHRRRIWLILIEHIVIPWRLYYLILYLYFLWHRRSNTQERQENETSFGQLHSVPVNSLGYLSRCTTLWLQITVIGTLSVQPSTRRSGTIRKFTIVGTGSHTDVGVLWGSVLKGRFGEDLRTRCLLPQFYYL